MNPFTLTNDQIAQAVEAVTAFMQKYRLTQKECLRITLALEDTLLNYRDAFGENTDCTLRCIQHFGRLRIELSVNAASYNPFLSKDEDDFSRLLLTGIGMAPDWKYKDGQNCIAFTPKKQKASQMVYIASALCLALLCAALSKALPAYVQTLISQQLFTMLSDTYLDLLNAVAGMMIFLSVAFSICSLGDVATFTNIGKKMLSHMLFMLLLLPLFFALCILPLFTFSGRSGADALELSGIFEMLIGIVPTNLFTPFIEGNFLQIIFLAAIVGSSLLVLGSKVSLIAALIEQANTLVQLLLEVLCSFIPFVIFMTLYNMLLSGSFSVLLEAYKAPLLLLLGGLSAMCLYLCLICFTQKVRPDILLHKITPAFFIALTTASSSAAMSAKLDACEHQLGINKKLVNFGVPLGQIIFGIGSVMEFIVLGFCMAEIYQVTVTPVWIGMTVLISVILTIAAPPIPGGGVALCTLLFHQLGLPPEGLAAAVAIDVIADFFITAMDTFCQQCELVLISARLHMLDTSRLRKKTH